MITGWGRAPGEGNGYPLLYSCLKNPMDRGAWQAIVHRVTKSWTQLSHLEALGKRGFVHHRYSTKGFSRAYKNIGEGFPGGSVVKNPAARRRHRFHPCSGKIHMLEATKAVDHNC